MAERRFTEDEVAAILEAATRLEATEPRQIGPGEGLTLGEIQAVGREAGIPPDLIRQAANALGQGGRSSSRRFLGLPIGVGRVVDLGRKLGDDEWDRFVVDLRETFDARGSVRRDASLRQWTNGNLQVLVEPTANGDRVRMRTTKGNVRGLMMLGLGGLGLSAVTLISGAMTGVLSDPGKLSSIASFAIMGATAIGVSAAQLPGWARRRREQMESLERQLTSAESVSTHQAE
jgi:hypothetical protein